jgi:hypothetical protein
LKDSNSKDDHVSPRVRQGHGLNPSDVQASLITVRVGENQAPDLLVVVRVTDFAVTSGGRGAVENSEGAFS